MASFLQFGNILYLLFIFINNNADALENCTSVQQREGPMFKILTFSEIMPSDSVGFSVDIIFSGPIQIIQANDSRHEPAMVTQVYERHWIISVFKVPKSEVRRAEFNATYRDLVDDVKLEGVILNGDQLICGEGVTKVITPSQFKIEDTKECKPSKITGYEHESRMTIREEFVSERIGLVIDVVFDSDVDNIEVFEFFPQKNSDRHYSMFNSGYITSKDKVVEVSFQVFHEGRPLPSLLAVIMNDVVVCGFSTTRKVFNDETLISVSKMLNERSENLRSLDNLITSSVTISVFALLAALMSGLAVWKLTYPQFITQSDRESVYTEPVYSKPK